MSGKVTSDAEFYVGYMPHAPKDTGRFVRRVVLGILGLAVAVPVLFAIAQKKFSTSTFEFGTLREIRGTILREPLPMLRVRLGKDIDGNAVFRSIPLVATGKFGAHSILDAIRESSNGAINEAEATLRGTLIFHDGKTLLELTEGEGALVAIHEESTGSIGAPETTDLGRTTVRGEIVDSKCYFGVMKPGQGKPHKACAVRCISGGIPPVVMMRNAAGEADYLLLVASDGRPINDRVLQYVAEGVEISGDLIGHDDWMLLRVDPATGIRRL